MIIEIPDTAIEQLADRLADRLLERVEQGGNTAGTPWKNMEEAAEYTRLPFDTFKKLAADGTFRSHGRRRKVFHVSDLDRGLGFVPPGDAPTPLRRNAA